MDQGDIIHYQVTAADFSDTIQRMWGQFFAACQKDALPAYKRGLNPSLYIQGFGQHASGVSPRPSFPFQQDVANIVQSLVRGRKKLDATIQADWCLSRTTSLQNWDLGERQRLARRTRSGGQRG